MKFQRKEIVTVTTAFAVGVCMGMYVLSKDNPGTRHQSNVVNARFRSAMMPNTTGLYVVRETNIEDSWLTRKPVELTNETETDYLIQVLSNKYKQLRDSKMLDTISESHVCAKDEPVRGLCIDPNCTGALPPVFSKENIMSIRKPVWQIGLKNLQETIDLFNVPKVMKKYVIISGASSNHFTESLTSLNALQDKVFPHLTNFSFFFYDLGLKPEERTKIDKYKATELKQFPFDKLPEAFRMLRCYTWKPLIILAHLQWAENLIWMDTSVKFKDTPMSYFEKAAKTGILINRNRHNFPQHVYSKMFDYFGDRSCQFSKYGELEGGFQVLHNEVFTRRLIIEPWAACAIDPQCMCPEASRRMIDCGGNRKYSKCHRYDQATIGYIVLKAFRDNYESVVIKKFVHDVKGGQ